MPRKAKPTALKILHGDFEKNPQKRNKREPQPPRGRPACPQHLKGEARKAYKRCADLLAQMKVLTQADREALETYAQAYQKWRDALALVERDGMVIHGIDALGNKTIKRNPADRAVLEYGNKMIKLLSEMGLTPSSRTRLQVEQATNTNQDKAKKYLA